MQVGVAFESPRPLSHIYLCPSRRTQLSETRSRGALQNFHTWQTNLWQKALLPDLQLRLKPPKQRRCDHTAQVPIHCRRTINKVQFFNHHGNHGLTKTEWFFQNIPVFQDPAVPLQFSQHPPWQYHGVLHLL